MLDAQQLWRALQPPTQCHCSFGCLLDARKQASTSNRKPVVVVVVVVSAHDVDMALQAERVPLALTATREQWRRFIKCSGRLLSARLCFERNIIAAQIGRLKEIGGSRASYDSDPPD